MACGHSPVSSSVSAAGSAVQPTVAGSVSAAGSPAQSPTSVVTTQLSAAPVSAPGCGTYCQQAGESAGNAPEGYPCPQVNQCLKCPPQNCVSLRTNEATAINGVITVPLTCNISTSCQGVFLMCVQSYGFCQGGSQVSTSGRLAGSDFVVPPGTTSDVAVGLTSAGKELAAETGGFSPDVIIEMLNYGYVLDTQESGTTFSLMSTDPPTFPASATASCGQGVFVGPDTSCPFALNVMQAYVNSNAPSNQTSTITAESPVTDQTYTMQCSAGLPFVCRGGTNAFVAFYP
jgi:hypothetical protein